MTNQGPSQKHTRIMILQRTNHNGIYLTKTGKLTANAMQNITILFKVSNAVFYYFLTASYFSQIENLGRLAGCL